MADNAFVKWMKTQTKENTVKIDPVAEKIKVALSSLVHDNAFRLAARDTLSNGRRVRAHLGLQSVGLSRVWGGFSNHTSKTL